MNIIQNNGLKWIAIYTKPRHEKSVEKELLKKGFEVYLPLLKERRKWSDRKKWVEFPLFRSYIFVRTQEKNTLFILQTIGVVKLVKFGNKVAIVQDESIRAIKLMIEGGYNPKATDYFLTGGAILTWWVVPFMLLAGFLTPWPYNYWRLKKFNIACH